MAIAPATARSGRVRPRRGPADDTDAGGPAARAVRGLIEETLGTGDLSDADDRLSEGYTGSVAGMADLPPGPGGFKRFAARLRAALFEADVRTAAFGTASGQVVVGWSMSGRLERPLLGIEPAARFGRGRREPGGPRVTVSGRTVARVARGRIQSSRTERLSARVDDA